MHNVICQTISMIIVSAPIFDQEVVHFSMSGCSCGLTLEADFLCLSERLSLFKYPPPARYTIPGFLQSLQALLLWLTGH